MADFILGFLLIALIGTTSGENPPGASKVALTGCGENKKSCFYFNPKASVYGKGELNCKDQCDFKLAITTDSPQPGKATIDMVGQLTNINAHQTYWLAVAFNEKDEMGGADVYACQATSTTGTSNEYVRYTNPNGHTPSTRVTDQSTAVLKDIENAQGYIYCKLEIVDMNKINLNSSTYVIFTAGPVTTEFGLGKHTGSPLHTEKAVDLSKLAYNINLQQQNAGSKQIITLPIAFLSTIIMLNYVFKPSA